VFSADPSVVDVHKHVRTGLNLSQSLDISVDVVRSGTCAAEDLNIVPFSGEQLAGSNRLGHCVLGNLKTVVKAHYMGDMSGVSADSVQLQVARPLDMLG